MRHVGRFLTVNCGIAKKGTSAGIDRNRTVYLAAVGSRLTKYPRPSNASSGIRCECAARFLAESHRGTSLRITNRGLFRRVLMLLMDIDKAHVRDDIDEAKEVLRYLSKSKQEYGPFPDHVPSHRARTPNSWSPAKKLAGEEPSENPVPQTHL